jgi:hypothetical protein
MREPPHLRLPGRPGARSSGWLRWASGLCGAASRCGQPGHGDRYGRGRRRVADGDDAVLADPETFSDFKQAVSRLQSREPFLAEAFSRDTINAELRQAFTIVRGSR